ncbi:MAG TPA: cardiolipin synthase B [Burkholderiales bacterium]|nr:cardiolipin synthase B [Burkholderiales bacterium]
MRVAPLSGFISIAAIVIVAALILLLLFEPGLPYRVTPSRAALGSREFVNYLSAIVNARLFATGELHVLNTGAAIYAAEVEAVRAAKKSIHLEVYLFLRGRAGDEALRVLTEKARSGVAVRIVVDRIGSLMTPDDYFAGLRAAGGRVYWYQPIAWYTLKRFNNRTHRDILIVDGEVGFVGGVGVADYWLGPPGDGLPWRDTMVRLTGDLVKGLQTSFAENWLEAAGEVLPETEFALDEHGSPRMLPAGTAAGMVVNSTPSAGRSTRARLLFQVLVASARESIQICSPYFLPDRSLLAELEHAARRGVPVTVLTPGKWNNHPITRLGSRQRYGRLLKAGVQIYEYQPTMIHAKVFLVDRLWAVVGSTNFDNRSFGLNDEVNLAVLEPRLAQELARDFAADLQQTQCITLEQWRRRSYGERALALLGRLLERQV